MTESTSGARVTIWNEYRHERNNPIVTKVYPEGIHNALKEGLASYGFEIGTATLDEPQHGLTDEVLESTDVLVWWGHMAHDDVDDTIVEKVHNRVLQGMGLIVLHSGHYAKIFKKLMGTSCALKWREADEKERLWVVNPSHPIAAGIGEYIELPQEEMYGEHFDIPAPDELVFVSWFEGGEVFRSGCAYYRGQGKVFYFRPGHESYPTYYNKDVLRVIANAVNWAAATGGATPAYGHVPVPLERIRGRE
ncbi:trehalose utilization protein [Paenibacillus taihuensis]|uniref:Trehalose utilization protein n=1 Tax=Paenibacillus taihuensis TaxID=1156355 RepID=A0A3D9QTL3_9BACL|nr:ThuA domain-containing protein [Paenibacillus taihuensis]REE66643.1 trehalose utilization protein [Paenibacillus taihuensis]